MSDEQNSPNRDELSETGQLFAIAASAACIPDELLATELGKLEEVYVKVLLKAFAELPIDQQKLAKLVRGRFDLVRDAVLDAKRARLRVIAERRNQDP